MAINIQFRRGTASEWTAANPTLAVAEMGVETDTDKFKLGDGATAWTSLGYGGIQGLDGTNGTDGTDGTFSSTQTIETKSVSYTLVSGDAGKLILNSAAITITVQGLAVGQQVDFLQSVAGQITFAAAAGSTLSSRESRLKTAAQGSASAIKCTSANTYWLIGDLG